MSLDARETSRAEGAPTRLYKFDLGGLEVGHTDGETDFFWNGLTYEAVPISHGDIVSSGGTKQSSVEVVMAASAPLAVRLRGFPLSAVLGVTIFQGHPEDGEFLAAFVGRVSSRSVKGAKVHFACEGAGASMQRTGLRRHYQYGCPHVLYGPQCRADKSRATTQVVVASVNGPIVTLPTDWVPLNLKPKHRMGLFAWTDGDGLNEVRTILRVDGDELLLSGTADTLLPGFEAQVSWGCDHTLAGDCRTLHLNAPNFGGQPFIPLKNPVGLTNNFY